MSRSKLRDLATDPARRARVEALREEVFGSDLTADDAAYVLGVDRMTVLAMLRRGDMLGYKLGGYWRIPRDEFARFRERQLARARGGTDAPA